MKDDPLTTSLIPLAKHLDNATPCVDSNSHMHVFMLPVICVVEIVAPCIVYILFRVAMLQRRFDYEYAPADTKMG